MDSKLYHDIYHYLDDGEHLIDLTTVEEKKQLKQKKRNFRKKHEPFVVKEDILKKEKRRSEGSGKG